MDHLLTVAGLLATATFVTGLVLPLTTRERHRDGTGPDVPAQDEVGATRWSQRR